MQIVAAQNIVDQLRAVAQLRCLETLLPSLVQTSRWQRLRDTAHSPPQCTPRRRAGENQQLNTTAQFTSRKKRERNVDCLVCVCVCVTWTSPGLLIGKRELLTITADQLRYKTPLNSSSNSRQKIFIMQKHT